MEYKTLTIGINQKLRQCLKSEFAEAGAELIPAMDVGDGVRLLMKQPFSLIITDLHELEQSRQLETLTGLRRMRYAPILALIDNQDMDLFASALDSGVDVCQPFDLDPILLSKQAKALLRRYTDYNHWDQSQALETAPFWRGDIYIDPPQHIVKVRDRLVRLRPREFNLLFLFMSNPNVILSTEEICERAWKMGAGYDRGVSQPIYLLRKAIEPDPDNPIYIHTVHRLGYCFTPNNVETCDKCESSVIGL